MKKRPILREIPLASVYPLMKPGGCFLTIDPGAWDVLIEVAYDDGWVILEMENDTPIRAYQKAEIITREDYQS